MSNSSIAPGRYPDVIDESSVLISASSLRQLPSIFSTPFVVAIALGFILLIAITRITSGHNAQSAQNNGVRKDARDVPLVPYWVPVIGHIPNMILNATEFLAGVQDTYRSGIFALNFGGQRHNVLYSPSLVTALLNQKPTNADAEKLFKGIMEKTFGFPRTEEAKYDEAVGELNACYKLLISEPSLGDIVNITARKLRENIANLVTFSASRVDEMPWERVSNDFVSKNLQGEDVVEASLLPLIRDFCAMIANDALFGSDFLANFPSVLEDLWTLDRGFLLLATGLPRWVPLPALTKAHIARRRIIEAMETFHEALAKHSNGEDPGAKWSSLDDVGALIKARTDVYTRHNLSMRARASNEHALFWAANANSNTLIFWMINHIYADAKLLALIREEIAPYISAFQPKLEEGMLIAEPVRVSKLDIQGLCDNCPLLKSCYIETLRVDTESWSLKIVQQDFVLQERDKSKQGFLLRKGEYAHAAHNLHNMDPNAFENPMVWKADRHIRRDENKTSADLGSIRPYGGGTNMCKGRAFAFKEAMMFTAAIATLWDIEPVGGGAWKMPSHKKATGVCNTNDVTRVWLRPRRLPTQ